MDSQLPGDPTDGALGLRRIRQRVQRPSSWPARPAPASTSLSPMTVILTCHHCLHQTRRDSPDLGLRPQDRWVHDTQEVGEVGLGGWSGQ